LGRCGTLDIHFGKYAVECGNPGDYFLIFRALKLQRQLVHTPLDLSARKLLREYELDWHRRCIAQYRTEGQERLSVGQAHRIITGIADRNAETGRFWLALSGNVLAA
jgi:hypothetical protein